MLQFIVVFFIKGYKLALPFYGYLFGVSTAVLSYKALLARPMSVARKFVENVLQSSTFLASYCTIGLSSKYIIYTKPAANFIAEF